MDSMEKITYLGQEEFFASPIHTRRRSDVERRLPAHLWMDRAVNVLVGFEPSGYDYDIKIPDYMNGKDIKL